MSGLLTRHSQRPSVQVFLAPTPIFLKPCPQQPTLHVYVEVPVTSYMLQHEVMNHCELQYMTVVVFTLITWHRLICLGNQQASAVQACQNQGA